MNNNYLGNLGYYPFERRNPKTKTKQWYAALKNYSTINRNQVIDYAVTNSNIERSVLETAMTGLCQLIKQFLLNGHNISIDNFGCFYLSNTSRGELTADEVTSDDVKKAYVRFRPCKALRQDLQQVPLFDVTKKAWAEKLDE